MHVIFLGCNQENIQVENIGGKDVAQRENWV